MSKQASKGRLFGPDKLQNQSNEGNGKEKKKERGGGKEEKRKKKKVALLVFIIASLEKKNCWLQKVHKVFKNPSRSIDHYVFTTVIAQTQYACFQ